ncbi:hypothetical protein K6I34_000430, partial [Streptomyces sp. UNOC14_S4]|nr:hypothetical protein [Streptomyces sp. UNOC14_S4]
MALGAAPAEQPLHYPGTAAQAPVLLLGDSLLPLRAEPGTQPGAWRTPTGQTLDDVLPVPCGHRHPVIAVGSNASPAQLHHKL